MRSASVRLRCPATGSGSVWRRTQRGGHRARREPASVQRARGRSGSGLLLGPWSREASCSRSGTKAPLFSVRRLFGQARARRRLRSAQLRGQGSLGGSSQLGSVQPYSETHARTRTKSLLGHSLPPSLADIFKFFCVSIHFCNLNVLIELQNQMFSSCCKVKPPIKLGQTTSAKPPRGG